MGEGEPANTALDHPERSTALPKAVAPEAPLVALPLSHPEQHVQTEQRRSAPCPRALRRGARSRGRRKNAL